MICLTSQITAEAAIARDGSSDEESSMDLSDGGESEDEASQVARAKAFAAALKTSGETII